MAQLLRTPLFNEHLKLKARMVPFAGYEMPVQYSGVLDEVKACRKFAGLFDVSHMGQFVVRGNNALSEVQKLVTNNLSRLQLGQAQYNMLCNEKAGVIDDLIVYHRGESESYICVNASNRKTDFDWMKQHLKNVELIDESDATALIALQGPQSVEILQSFVKQPVIENLKYYWGIDTQFNEFPIYLSRTGYTGEDGFEIYANEKFAQSIWNLLLEVGTKHALLPCGLGSRDTLRTEMGYPLHGHELSQEISPLEAGLGWVVKTDGDFDFIGKKILIDQKTHGVPKKLIGLTIQDKRIARTDYPILSLDGKEVGKITSGTMSPHVGKPVALGFVESSYSNQDSFLISVRNERINATKSKLPFIPSRTKK